MNDLLKKDITIKVASILFAILLWLFVLNNIDNPFQNTSIAVPIRILNENALDDKGLGIRNKNYLRSVEVEIKGRRDQVSMVTANDLEAYVDFSSIKDAGKKELKVEVISVREGVRVGDIRPKTINIEVDKIVKKDIKVTLVPVGKPKENYKVIKMTATPETVTIEGLESIVNSVASVKAAIDINNIAKSVVIRKEYKSYNKNDEEIIGLNKGQDVEVNVEVAKEVPVNAVIKGKAAKDFVDTGYNVSVKKVWVTGLPEVLDSIVELNTEQVNIDNISKNTDFKTNIRLPEGIKLVDTSKEVVVSVSVEALAVKNFEIKKEDISVLNMDENLFKYEITNASISLGIKGRQKDLNVIDPYSFRPSIDVAGLEEGTHLVPLKITINNNDLRIVDEYSIEIKISKK